MPAFASGRPRWWGASPSSEWLDADDIVRGYLGTYDPDWVVTLVDGLTMPEAFGDRVAEATRYGLTTHLGIRAHVSLEPLIAHQYDARFRFTERITPQVVFHEGDGPLLGDVLLGRLADEGAAGGLAQDFSDRLGAEAHELTPDLLVRSQIDVIGQPEIVTLLRLGSEGLMVRPRTKRWTYLYFCSLRRPWDAVELWNLRAAALDVYALPVEWLDVLDGPVQRLLASDDVLPIAARRLTDREFARAAEAIGKWGFPLAAPPVFWTPNPTYEQRPAMQVMASDITTCAVVDERAEIPTLSPEWANRRRPGVSGGWVNELRIYDDLLGGELAGVLPHDLSDLGPLLNQHALSRPGRLVEGRLVAVVDRPGATVDITVPTGIAVFRAWMKQRGLTVRMSDPGRTALEISRKLGGVDALGWALGPNRLAMLEQGTRRHHLPAQKVQRAIRDDGFRRHEAVLGGLTHKEALRAGLLVDCRRCGHVNFVLPEALGESMPCERCLESIRFPHEKPPSRWAYRPVGPFAVRDFARGSYAALLAVRALTAGFHFSGTWCPSVEIDGVGELDFALWRQGNALWSEQFPPELVIGEAKTFDQFVERDVKRMTELRLSLRQGWICFATLRTGLTFEEQRMIREGMDELHGPNEMAPVIVLTALELWSKDVTEVLGPAFAGSSGRDLYSWDATTAFLAEATQRLHLCADTPSE